MGKNRIEIERIEDKTKRMVTFTKRRQGLFKKAAMVCVECDANIAVIAFSRAGHLFSFGHSSVDSVINRYLTGKEVEEEEEEEKENRKMVEHDQERRVSDGGFWWDHIEMDKLDSVEKLLHVQNTLMNLKHNVSKRLEDLTSTSSSSSYIEVEAITNSAAAGTAAAAPTAAAIAAAAAAAAPTIEEDLPFLMEGDGFCWPTDDDLADIAKILDDGDEMGQQLTLADIAKILDDGDEMGQQLTSLLGDI